MFRLTNVFRVALFDYFLNGEEVVRFVCAIVPGI